MKKDVKKSIILASVAAGLLGSAVAAGKVIADNVIGLNHNDENDMHLLAPNAHLSEGTHRVVLTHNFYQYLTYETTEEQQKRAIDGILAAYDNLNQYFTNLKFEVCTESKYLAEEFGITKVPCKKDSDIQFYISNDKIDNSEYVLANTSYKVYDKTGWLFNQKVTFRKDYLFLTWQDINSKGDIDNPEDSLACYITKHESGHLLGIEHITNKKSIMYPSISYENRNFSKYDIQLFGKLDKMFYSTQKENYTNTAATYADVVKNNKEL